MPRLDETDKNITLFEYNLAYAPINIVLHAPRSSVRRRVGCNDPRRPTHVSNQVRFLWGANVPKEGKARRKPKDVHSFDPRELVQDEQPLFEQALHNHPTIENDQIVSQLRKETRETEDHKIKVSYMSHPSQKSQITIHLIITRLFLPGQKLGSQKETIYHPMLLLCAKVKWGRKSLGWYVDSMGVKCFPLFRPPLKIVNRVKKKR